MSFITPILMVPSVYWACAVLAPPSRASARADRLTSCFMVHFMGLLPDFLMSCILSCGPAARLDAQIFVKLAEIGLQLGADETVDDPTMFHHVEAVCNRGSKAEILLDQQ